ncbi:hypothetical protein [Devosia sp. 2618]|uniref:hypothetical protein n=1 Tax=Devosia sp. 2618 TaxID=3156454 RepID=UPI003398AADB
MHQQQVLEVQVTDAGQIYKAAYYVEFGVIHASILGSVVVLPASGQDAAGLVRAILTERILERAVRLRNSSAWQQRSAL